VLRDPSVVAFPKASDTALLNVNRHALAAEDLAAIDVEFLRPVRKTRVAELRGVSRNIDGHGAGVAPYCRPMSCACQAAANK
jgi:hypothetical protein